MKKISILLFAVMMAGSLSAQIEEVSAEQYATKKEQREKSSLDYLPKVTYPANLLKIPYNLIGQQVYCTKDQIDGKPIIAVTISQDGAIGLKRLKKSAYYNVTDIICGRYERGKWQEKNLVEFMEQLQKSKNFVGDTIHYIEKGKEKIYTLSKSKDKDIPMLLEPRKIRQHGPNGDVSIHALYELTDSEGLKHYIGEDEVFYQMSARYYLGVIKTKNDFTIAIAPSINDFISVNTFNYLKAKYEKKEVVAPGYYDPCAYGPCDKGQIMLEKHVMYVEKIGVEKGKIVCAIKDPSCTDIQVREYKGEKECTATRHRLDTIQGLFVEGYWCAFPFRTAADSLLNKWNQEEQIKEAQARAEKAKQKAEYIKKYGEKYAQNILDGKVCVGMTSAMCKEAMGRPNNTTRNSSSLGMVEIWTYSTWYPLVPITVVTFLDDKVTSVDEYKDNFPF